MTMISIVPTFTGSLPEARTLVRIGSVGSDVSRRLSVIFLIAVGGHRVRRLLNDLVRFAYGSELASSRTLCRPHWSDPVNDEFIALEIDDDQCGRLQFELPLDVTDAEIEYIRSLVPSLQSGTLELLDPNTGEVMFTCTPVLVH